MEPARARGHQRYTTQPTMYFFGTKPQWRLVGAVVPPVAHDEVIPFGHDTVRVAIGGERTTSRRERTH